MDKGSLIDAIVPHVLPLSPYDDPKAAWGHQGCPKVGNLEFTRVVLKMANSSLVPYRGCGLGYMEIGSGAPAIG